MFNSSKVTDRYLLYWNSMSTFMSLLIRQKISENQELRCVTSEITHMTYAVLRFTISYVSPAKMDARELKGNQLVPVIALSSSVFLCGLILYTETFHCRCYWQNLERKESDTIVRCTVIFLKAIIVGTTNRSESCVHTSVSASVGQWPGAPVRVLSCFCWVELELTDPNGAFWESQGCSTGIWLWLCAWACRGSWHALLLSGWAAVVAVPVSTPFGTGEEKSTGWTDWAEGTSSGWLSWGT